jgi:hypothetical protein
LKIFFHFFDRKKLSNFSHSHDWLKDSNNYVAKRYMSSDIERMTYFEDVKLQVSFQNCIT